MKLVSIAMTTYNGEKFIKEQLDSLLNQTYKNLEIIICDDGSSDKTIEIIKEYEQKNRRIKLFQNKKNLGVLKNFEKAISLCCGEYIALCDQDDIWLENKIEILLQEIDNNILVFHDDKLIDDDGVIESESFFKRENINPNRLNSVKNILCDNWISGHALMFHNTLKNEIFPMPKEVEHFDWWIALMAIVHGDVKYIDLSLVLWRQHKSNTSGNKLIKRSLIEKFFFPIDRATFMLWNKNRVNRLEKIKSLNIINSRSDFVFLNQLINYYRLDIRINAFFFAIFNINYIVIKSGILRKIKYILLPLFAPKVNI